MTNLFRWWMVRFSRFLPLNAFPARAHVAIFASILLAASGILPEGISLMLCPVVCLAVLVGYRVSRDVSSSSD
ncbi:MAG: hypothetical protein MK108_15810 [Mariniblastus sp.]|nr:hypothetical protein [Mariniblastus sp.]